MLKPFHGPCYRFMQWMRAVANERIEAERRIEIIAELKEWFRKIIRLNKGHGVNVVACSDTVLLQFLNCKKEALSVVKSSYLIYATNGIPPKGGRFPRPLGVLGNRLLERENPMAKTPKSRRK